MQIIYIIDFKIAIIFILVTSVPKFPHSPMKYQYRLRIVKNFF